MSTLQFGGDDEAEKEPEIEDPEDVSQWIFGGRSGTIFLIDASPEMFIPPEYSEEEEEEEELEDECPFICSLKAAHATLMRKIVSNDQDLLAVILFNTRETKNPIDFPHIYILQGLQRPSAEKILELEEWMSMDKKKFEEDYGQTTDATIHDALRVCQSVLTICKRKLTRHSILMFTCRDDPHPGDASRFAQARNKVRDLREIYVVLEILPLGPIFDINKFYKDLLIPDDEEEVDKHTLEYYTLFDPTQRLSELMDRVRRLEHKQRTTGSVPFTLFPGLEIHVGVYTIISKMCKPKKVLLWKKTNEEVLTMKKDYLEKTGELMMPSDLIKYVKYGGRKIAFTLDEVKNISRIYKPGMQLLGFRDVDSIKPDHYVKPPNFLFPDEKTIKGSTKVFSTLLYRCLAKKKAAIVRLVVRKGMHATLSALIPQAEVVDDKNVQLVPPGFIVCHLPFSDDVRNIQLENRTRATSSQVDAAKRMIKRMKFNYNPENFGNPDIETHWENVKALALNRSQVEPVEDCTVPNHDYIEEKVGAYIAEFKSQVYPPSYDPSEPMKRQAAAPKPAPKKPKPDLSLIDVETEAKEGRANELTVPVLKAWLKPRGVIITGKKKAELIQDVMDEIGQ